METFQKALLTALPSVVHTDALTRGIYATDASHYQIMPAAVLIPETEAQVIEAIQLASQHNTSVTARGAGTSLSGQTHGEGLVIDLSKHFNQVLEIQADEQWARVQPGVIRDHLNQAVNKHGLFFAPDPATGNRASIGGMLGNNSSGMRSILYGKTSDHVLGCRVALSSGEVLELKPTLKNEWMDDRCGEIYRGLQNIVQENKIEIEARFPKVMRSVSGYALDRYTSDPTEGPWDLSQILCGSEGTLGIVLEVTVKLCPQLKHTAMVALHFHSLMESLNSLERLVASEPSAIELLDHIVLDEARKNSATRHLCGFIRGRPQALLLVELHGETAEQLKQKTDSVAYLIQLQNMGYAAPLLTTAESQQNAWDVRRLGLGLITNKPGPQKGQAFVEDACIPLLHLAEYIKRLLKICEEEKIPVSVYGHASVGVLHVRPMLDLHLPEHIEKMRRIAQQAFAMVIEYGGAWSGEHGDGLVRGEFIEPFFGKELIKAFREVKQLFDPAGIMNSHKLIDTPGMTEHLRYQQKNYAALTQQADKHSHFQFRAQGGLTAAVEQCNGVGACRKIGSGSMCPSYMATRNEKDCTRGRANALRLAISGQLNEASSAQNPLASQSIQDVMKFCLSCKACKNECPNSVDVAKMKSEALQQAHDVHGAKFSDRVLATLPSIGEHFTGPLSFPANVMQQSGFFKTFLQKTVGIDTRRNLPLFARRSLRKEIAGRPVPEQADVIFYVDSNTNIYEPYLGIATLKLLDDAGLKTRVSFAGDSQRPRISRGFLRAAKKYGTRVMSTLDRLGTNDTPILCIEPSCASALVDDLPDLIEDAALGKRVAARICLIEDLILKLSLKVECDAEEILVHGHCHQKAVFDMQDLKKILPQAKIIDAGCCGMAGAFGYENFELSQTIGNDRFFPALEKRNENTVVIANGISCRYQAYDRLGFMPKHLIEVMRIK